MLVRVFVRHFSLLSIYAAAVYVLRFVHLEMGRACVRVYACAMHTVTALHRIHCQFDWKRLECVGAIG